MPDKDYIEDIKKLPRKLSIFFLLLAMLLVLGTLGFKVLVGETFSQSFVYVLETLAFMYKGGTGATKVLEVFLILFGVTLMWWILWSIFDLLSEGKLTEYLKIRDVLNKQKKMKAHYIIAGGGRVGEELARELQVKRKPYIIIEKNEEIVSKLKKKGFFAIQGDVTDENVLKEANLKDSKVLFLALPETEKNLLVTITAKEIYPKAVIYARADKPIYVSKMKKAGAKVVIVPEVAAAEEFMKKIK